jgi:hypothetical protein
MRHERPTITCRAINSGDLAVVAQLLAQGFPNRKASFWTEALTKLSHRDTPPGYPRFGYALFDGDRPVGVLLLIFAVIPFSGSVRCNVSSWYVERAFASYAPLLSSRALNHKNVTYLNATPAKPTWDLLEAQGYRRLSKGRFIAIPLLSPRGLTATVQRVLANHPPIAGLSPAEHRLLADHAAMDCLALVIRQGDQFVPIVLQLRRNGWKPKHALLIWCRNQGDIVHFAGAIGRTLAVRAVPFLVIATDAPIAGLAGRYIEKPTFSRGPERPAPGDLAYTEYAVLGL